MNGCQCPRGKIRVMKKTGDGEERSMRDLLVLSPGSVGFSLSFLFSLSLQTPFFICCKSSLLICFWSHFFSIVVCESFQALSSFSCCLR